MASVAQFQFNAGLSSAAFFGQRLPICSPHLANSYKKPCLITMQIKPWERTKVKPNSLPILKKMHVKLGDTIKVMSGREKGKVGEVMKIYTHNSTIIVKDINLKTKHMKGKQEGEAGQIIEIEGPIHSSNVMLYSKTQKMASRVGHKVLEDGRKVRYLLKTGEILDSPEQWKKIFKEKDDKSKTTA
ncbi:large ribosomal subunit protein uL24c [Cryptomeria japonica]|uniref:large ribosomal subunit protein uL24c n=1 Tax=Cryptomeria japonica TaxID=3369 RepID=UPI0025AB7B1B|nr:large ribosomal subunit protein uL24c [Cryptomeria japonica]